MPRPELRLEPKLQQKLVITAQLQLAIRLLQLNQLDLVQEVAQQLVENPALEEASTTLEAGSTPESAEKEKEVSAGEDAERDQDDIDYEAFFQHLEDSYQRAPGEREAPNPDLPTIEQVLRTQGSLSEHLLWQLEMSAIPGRLKPVGEAILGNLDERGYLQATTEEIARMAPEGEAWAPEEIEQVRRVIQRFDPVGVASRDLRECLLVQLEVAGLADSPAARIVRDHLDLVEEGRDEELAEAIGVGLDDLDEVLEVIRHLDPSPGTKYNARPVTYIIPDVFVVKDGNDYRILLNEDGLPKLRLSPSYRRFLERISRGDEKDPEAKKFIREKVRAALHLIRSLDERQRTIYKVARSIVKFQRPFLDHGVEHLRPLVLRDVADDIGMHESTVSRVVNQKYMHTPRGLFEMRFFFHSGISSSAGQAVSSLSVKDKIRRLIEEEDPDRPLSDQAIAEILHKEGLEIARRTVNKYREDLGIPPSTQRRRRRRSKRR